MDCSRPGSSIHGLLQARILDWVVMPSSRGSSLPGDQTCISSIGRWFLYHWGTWKAPMWAQHALKLRSGAQQKVLAPNQWLIHVGTRKTNWQGAYHLQAVREEDKIQPETHCAWSYLRSCRWKRPNWELLEMEIEAEDEEEGSIFKGKEPYVHKHGSKRRLWSFKKTSGERAQNYR